MKATWSENLPDRGWGTLKSKWGREKYIDSMSPRGRKRIADVRLATTNAKCDKIKDQKGQCRVCGEMFNETGYHLVFKCNGTNEPRTLFKSRHRIKQGQESMLRAMYKDESYLDQVAEVFEKVTEEPLFPRATCEIALQPESELARIEAAGAWLKKQ